MEHMLKDGKEKRKEDKRFLASAIAREFTVHQDNINDAHFVAIMAAMVKGEWDRKAVTTALSFSDIETKFLDVQQELMDSGIRVLLRGTQAI